MFWNNFVSLCNQQNTTPTSVVRDLNISVGSVTHWKNGKVPHHATLKKLADYFDVPVGYLLGEEKKELASPLTPTLTPEEQLLLTQWRSHPDAQPFVRKLLDMPEPQEQERPAVS